MVNAEAHKSTEYFFAGPTYDSKQRESVESTQQIHKEFDNVFNGIWCFEGTFSLQLKPDSKLYLALLKCVAYTLQNLFQGKLERLQKQDIIVPLGVDEMLEWCNSYVLVPKANGKVSLYLDPEG